MNSNTKSNGMEPAEDYWNECANATQPVITEFAGWQSKVLRQVQSIIEWSPWLCGAPDQLNCHVEGMMERYQCDAYYFDRNRRLREVVWINKCQKPNGHLFHWTASLTLEDTGIRSNPVTGYLRIELETDEPGHAEAVEVISMKF